MAHLRCDFYSDALAPDYPPGEHEWGLWDAGIAGVAA